MSANQCAEASADTNYEMLKIDYERARIKNSQCTAIVDGTRVCTYFGQSTIIIYL
jgi:hypothetical protein